MFEIILASKSKVRKKILDENNINNRVEPSNVDEDLIKDSLLKDKATPTLISKNLAELKANKICLKDNDLLVLGADSVIDLNGELKHYSERKARSNFNFIEMVPILNNDIKIQQPINIFNASITARVSKLSVSYELYNITQLIFGSIGSDQNNYFELQPDMPVLGRQINLNISWTFQD